MLFKKKHTKIFNHIAVHSINPVVIKSGAENNGSSFSHESVEQVTWTKIPK